MPSTDLTTVRVFILSYVGHKLWVCSRFLTLYLEVLSTLSPPPISNLQPGYMQLDLQCFNWGGGGHFFKLYPPPGSWLSHVDQLPLPADHIISEKGHKRKVHSAHKKKLSIGKPISLIPKFWSSAINHIQSWSPTIKKPRQNHQLKGRD